MVKRYIKVRVNTLTTFKDIFNINTGDLMFVFQIENVKHPIFSYIGHWGVVILWIGMWSVKERGHRFNFYNKSVRLSKCLLKRGFWATALEGFRPPKPLDSNTVQYIILPLQSITIHCHCNTLQYIVIAKHYNTLPLQYNTLQQNTFQHNKLQYNILQYHTLKYCTIR